MMNMEGFTAIWSEPIDSAIHPEFHKCEERKNTSSLNCLGYVKYYYECNFSPDIDVLKSESHNVFTIHSPVPNAVLETNGAHNLCVVIFHLFRI